jgi:hypothetical protein
MEVTKDFLDLVKSCGAPLLMFIIGLFFPQVKVARILDAFRSDIAAKKE